MRSITDPGLNQFNIGNRWRWAIIYLLFLLLSVALAYYVSKNGALSGVLAVSVILGLPLSIYAMADIKFGALTLLVSSFFLMRITQLGTQIPFGIIIDILVVMVLIGVIVNKWRKNDLRLIKSGVSFFVLLWVLYNCLEFFNPIASREAWFYVIRTIAIRTLFFFIALEAIDDVGFLRKLVLIWIGLAFAAALYGLFQEFHGLLDIEKEWLMRDEERFRLFYNWGRFRVYSFLSDPTVFGILMAFSGLFCLMMANSPSLSLASKALLMFMAGTMFLSTVYTGTRTAFAMVPAGIVFYALVTFQRRILAATAVVLLLGAIVIFSPIRNLGPLIGANPLQRIRSAFKPSEDPSYLVRKQNQERIKPFIQGHPFGSGVGSIGVWGERFNPSSELAGFAPDSTYVRVAVELGWVGLAIYCGFFCTALIAGIKNYYRIRDPGLKTFAASALAVIYAIAIANYPQQAVIQVPNVFIFFALIASIVKLPQLDQKLLNPRL